MAKSKGKRIGSGSKSENWSHEIHTSRSLKKYGKIHQREQRNDPQDSAHNNEKNLDSGTNTVTKLSHKKAGGKRRYERSMMLSHDNYDKREEGKLRLHLSKTKRDIDLLRERLLAWDEVEEQAKFRDEELLKEGEKKRKNESDSFTENRGKAGKRGRLGPETWKLRGAARPAWEVYSFDTRYVDPHMEAHKNAKEKANRVQNIIALYKGIFFRDVMIQNSSELLLNNCREFVSLLVRYGLLSLEAKKYKSAREAFLEIIDLEGFDQSRPISNARCRLMRMYLEANRPDSARRLWERLLNNTSVWIRYSAALLEFVSWNIQNEPGSTKDSAEKLLTMAVKANVFCAYYIAFHDTFDAVMEYTEDIEDAADETLEQAIEYCTSEQMGSWIGTDGAVAWIRSFLRNSMKLSKTDEGMLGAKDLDWESQLAIVEESYQDSKLIIGRNEKSLNDDDSVELDVLMYAGMFRTAMDMLNDDGEFVVK